MNHFTRPLFVTPSQILTMIKVLACWFTLIPALNGAY